MVKVRMRNTPLDGAVAAYLARIVEEGNPLNYIGRYAFDRDSEGVFTVTVTLYADEELAQFGATKPSEPDEATER